MALDESKEHILLIRYSFCIVLSQLNYYSEHNVGLADIIKKQRVLTFATLFLWKFFKYFSSFFLFSDYSRHFLWILSIINL